MQCADVFFLNANICQLGMDQRKVNMLAREYATASKRRFQPVVISHGMISGLKEGQDKMSKSDPDSAIFMEDSVDDVKRKVKKAYCPPGIVEKNPILDYTKNIIFGYYENMQKGTKLQVTVQGVPTEYSSYEEVEADYKSEKLHPSDLKPAVADALNRILEPVRSHFQQGEPKKLLDKIKTFKITK